MGTVSISYRSTSPIKLLVVQINANSISVWAFEISSTNVYQNLQIMTSNCQTKEQTNVSLALC
jgi:hypothetical protein